MGRKSLPDGEGLYILSCNSIHSFFMAFPFDALFVDKGWKVVHSIEAMPPWRASRIVWKADGVVELPAGTIAATDTRVGDTLELIPSPSGRGLG